MRRKWFAALASGAFGTVRGLAGVALVLAATAGTASAGGPLPGAPEIASASIGGALTLLAGGMLMLTDRIRRK
jgi:hypothetical protein